METSNSPVTDEHRNLILEEAAKRMDELAAHFFVHTKSGLGDYDDEIYRDAAKHIRGMKRDVSWEYRNAAPEKK